MKPVKPEHYDMGEIKHPYPLVTQEVFIIFSNRNLEYNLQLVV